MYIRTVPRLLVLFATIPLIIYSNTIPDGSQKLGTLTDPDVQLAVKAINELFTSKGDSRVRLAERVVSVTIQSTSRWWLYQYQIEVSGGTTKELCTISIVSRPWIPGGLGNQTTEPPQCYPQKSGPSRDKRGISRTKRSDYGLEGAFEFLETAYTIQTNSSKYLVIIKHGGTSKKKFSYTLYNVDFARSTCKLEEIDDFTKNCYFQIPTTEAVASCTFVEIYYKQFDDPEYKILRQNCSKHLKPESARPKAAVTRPKRSDPVFIEALDFLERAYTILSNSSRFLRIKQHSHYVVTRERYIIYDVEFVKSACTLEYMDEFQDHWGLCNVDSPTAQTVAVCTFVELSYQLPPHDLAFEIVNHNCSTNSVKTLSYTTLAR